MSQINALNQTDISPLVQKLGKGADVNRDGHVSAPEFAQFLDQILHPDQQSAPAFRVTGPFSDRLVGFTAAPSTSPAASIQSRCAGIAQNLAPTADNLRLLAQELGASSGVLSADGLSLSLAGGEGSIGVRNLSSGSVWQWTGPSRL